MPEGRMLAIGTGPGPKNVLVELPDGSKTVVPYRVWKYQFNQKRRQLSDVYRTFTGFVKFDPRESEAGGKDVRNFVFRATGVKDQAIDVRATLWPSHEHVEIEQGDLVVVEGKFSVNKQKKDGEPVVYHNLSVSRISVNGSKPDGGVREGSVNTDDADDDEAY